MAADGIKSVALILKAFKTDFHTSHVADAVLNKLHDLMVQITNAASEIDRQQEGFRECSGAIHAVAEYISEQADTATNAINEACTMVSRQVDNLGDIKDKFTMATNTNPLSYAAIAALQLHPSHSSLLMHGQKLQCQIVLDATPGMPAYQGLADLTETDLLVKANTAYELMKVGKNDAPEGLCFVGARKLARGSVVLDLNSTEAASWLWDKNVKEDFIKNFGSMSIVRNREYKVLVQFVPISVNMEDPRGITHIEHIESDSGLSQGVIQRMTWVKPPAKQHASQRVAHLLFTLTLRRPPIMPYAIACTSGAKAVRSGKSYEKLSDA